MHPQAYRWLAHTIQAFGLETATVVDLGGRDVNGTVHRLFTTRPFVIDIRPGDGVDVVADAADWKPDTEFGVALCTEVFEHTPRWPEIIATAHAALAPGGVLLATCASRDRPPHSAIDGGPLRDGEFYRNVSSDELTDALAGFSDFCAVEADGHFGNDDLYCWAIK